MNEYWYEAIDDKDEIDIDSIVHRLNGFESNEPVEPREAVEQGFFNSIEEYYSLLHRVSLNLARTRIEEEHSPDADLVNAVRSLESIQESRNLLSERVRDWRESSPEPTEILSDLEERVEALQELEDKTRSHIESSVEDIAPNLSNLAPPMLAARLIELAGGLEELARLPSSTVQVLGAEDALFRHLQSGTPPPKHGVIYLHPYVRNTQEEERGSAARAVAGKLTIAARIDYYSNELNPELESELDKKIEEIRSK